MFILITVIGFILALSFLVIIHEIGHYVTAKIFGVRADEFGIGYPPKAVTLFRRWKTDFTLNWLPFGGFVRLAGEDREAGGPKKKSDEMFYNKPVWQRVIILSAGAGMNFIFGILAFSILYTFIGIPEWTTLDNGIFVLEVQPDSPAAEAGLELGDTVTSITAQEQTIDIDSSEKFIDVISQYSGTTVSLEVVRGLEDDVENLTVETYIRTEEETPEGSGALGIAISDERPDNVMYPWYEMPFRGAKVGIENSVAFSQQVLDALGMLAGQAAKDRALPSELAGPAGIAHQAYDMRIFSSPADTLNFLAVLSLNLAVFNLLPIPALDGGRIFFIMIEKIMGKYFSAKIEYYTNAIGMMALLLLIIVVTFRDVGNIFNAVF